METISQYWVTNFICSINSSSHRFAETYYRRNEHYREFLYSVDINIKNFDIAIICSAAIRDQHNGMKPAGFINFKLLLFAASGPPFQLSDKFSIAYGNKWKRYSRAADLFG